MAQTFNRWWRGINIHPTQKRQEILTNWLKYACKTVAIRGDQDQQRVVYTIAKRYNNSTYKQLTRTNALKVYTIVNDKQAAHKKLLKQLKELRAQVGQVNMRETKTIEKKPNKATIITKKRRFTHIVTGGNR
jgi:hypothetical protein